MTLSKPYQDLLIEQLKDPKEALGYLNAALEESRQGDEESKRVLLIALNNVATAHGSLAQFAKNTRLSAH